MKFILPRNANMQYRLLNKAKAYKGVTQQKVNSSTVAGNQKVKPVIFAAADYEFKCVA